ncbi:unnamed protein product [Symbiodinium microadriaticum]|nr:unnamed protein product [Symbiodinium sp. KB8]CAE7889491.1 unnamed protein product [Symbiodinium microadriaticum]|mmetsp:Transcript_71678/g.171186  ORF Transcript_71678/g.171186 Transcript_71678/m.171186 type:complete len:340 (+) Transcript_71678:44-1063(+)
MAVIPDPVLEEKAQLKTEQVQQIIRSVEKACEHNSDEERRWLLELCQPSNPCFATLVRLVYQPKYKAFFALRAVCLRAVQMLLQIAKMTFTDAAGDPDLGWKTFVELAGVEQAREAYPELVLLAQQQVEFVVASNAITLLSELGPSALKLEHVPLLLELLQVLPDRAGDISEVALRVHAWGGDYRPMLCDAIAQHPGGKILVEVLLQMINRCDEKRRQRALKVLTECFQLPEAAELLYTNDARVLVEILLRELPAHAEDVRAFMCYTGCLKALAAANPAARQHRRDEVLQVLEDLRQDDRLQMEVREQCAKVMATMHCGAEDLSASLDTFGLSGAMECS